MGQEPSVVEEVSSRAEEMVSFSLNAQDKR